LQSQDSRNGDEEEVKVAEDVNRALCEAQVDRSDTLGGVEVQGPALSRRRCAKYPESDEASNRIQDIPYDAKIDQVSKPDQIAEDAEKQDKERHLGCEHEDSIQAVYSVDHLERKTLTRETTIDNLRLLVFRAAYH
jgi:hypothetical protein